MEIEKTVEGITVHPKYGSMVIGHDSILTVDRICEVAFQLLPTQLTDISLSSNSRLFEVENQINFPNKIQSIEYDIEPETTIAKHISNFQKLPATVKNLTIKVRADWLSHENLLELIKNIPISINSVTLPNLFLWYPDDEIGNKQLAEIFSVFPHHIQQINTAKQFNPDEEGISDSRLKAVLINLPFSVKELIVRKAAHYAWEWESNRSVILNEFRNTNYFPESYKTLTKDVEPKQDILFIQAKNLLTDYTKNNSKFSLFFTFHWGRNHREAVNDALNNSVDLDSLLTRLKTVQEKEGFNPTGSLARRIRYIELLIEEKSQSDTIVNSNVI
ncbi:MAG: DUF5617 domain-containing protein [Tatlockia sp.]|nr:DUF5617 domain-containing protein [Tatlockia sp.]